MPTSKKPEGTWKNSEWEVGGAVNMEVSHLSNTSVSREGRIKKSSRAADRKRKNSGSRTREILCFRKAIRVVHLQLAKTADTCKFSLPLLNPQALSPYFPYDKYTLSFPKTNTGY